MVWSIFSTTKKRRSGRPNQKDKAKEKQSMQESLAVFRNQFLSFFLVPVAVFTVGVLGLFLCKLAVANAMPAGEPRLPEEGVQAFNLTDVDGTMYGEPMIVSAAEFLKSFDEEGMLAAMRRSAAEAKATPNTAHYAFGVLQDVVHTNGAALTGLFQWLNPTGPWGELGVMFLVGLGWPLWLVLLYLMNLAACVSYSITGLFADRLGTRPDGTHISDPMFSLSSLLGAGPFFAFTRLARKGFRYVGLGIVWFVLCMCGGLTALGTTLYTLAWPFLARFKLLNTPADAPYAKQPGLSTFATKVLAAKKHVFMLMTVLSLLFAMQSAWGGVGTAALVTCALILMWGGALMTESAKSVVLKDPSFVPIPDAR